MEDEHDLVFLTVVAPRQAPWSGEVEVLRAKAFRQACRRLWLEETQPQDLAPRSIVADERQGMHAVNQDRDGMHGPIAVLSMEV